MKFVLGVHRAVQRIVLWKKNLHTTTQLFRELSTQSTPLLTLAQDLGTISYVRTTRDVHPPKRRFSRAFLPDEDQQNPKPNQPHTHLQYLGDITTPSPSPAMVSHLNVVRHTGHVTLLQAPPSRWHIDPQPGHIVL